MLASKNNKLYKISINQVCANCHYTTYKAAIMADTFKMAQPM